jgi:UDP-glucose 4-epimerase
MIYERVTVTGAAGLIGSAVVRHLVSLGVEVTAVDAPGAPEFVPQASVPLHRIDLLDRGMVELLDAARPQAIVHAAAHPGGKSLREPVEDVRVNALGSMQLFDWCARSSSHVVYLSSSVVYGARAFGKIAETAELAPGTIYGVAKQACEQWLRILGHGAELNWTVLRLFATYGAGHQPSLDQGIVNIMLTQLLAGNRVVVRGALQRVRDLIYVDDVASAIVRTLSCPDANHKVMNIGTGVGVTIGEMIYVLADVLKRHRNEIEIVEEAGTVGDPFSNVADVAQMREVLGFEPRYSLAAGLQALVDSRHA